MKKRTLSIYFVAFENLSCFSSFQSNSKHFTAILKVFSTFLFYYWSILILDLFENFTTYNFNIKSVMLEDQHASLLMFKLLVSSTLLECMASCYFDFGFECKFLVYDQPNCFLGNPLMKNGTFNAPNGTIFYYERG